MEQSYEIQEIEPEEISKTENGLDVLVSNTNQLMDNANNFVCNVENVAKLYTQCVQIKEQTKQVQAWSNVKLAEITAKYKSCEDFLNKTFGERDKALSQHYKILDEAIASDDKTLIIEALKGISTIITKSPLEDFQQFAKLYEDTSTPLLDF